MRPYRKKGRIFFETEPKHIFSEESENFWVKGSELVLNHQEDLQYPLLQRSDVASYRSLPRHLWPLLE